MKKPQLPALDETIHRSYHELVDDLEVEIARLQAVLPDGTLQCRPGCSECCISFSVLLLEAAHILCHCQPAGRREVPGLCVFLENDRCSVYGCRPLLCRTQGLPLAYRNDDNVVEVSACPLNFPEDFIFTEKNLLFMDSFNGRLAALNEAYCLQSGLDASLRLPLRRLYR